MVDRRRLIGYRKLAVVVVLVLTAAVGMVAMTTASPATAGIVHTVTLVNDSGQDLWIGSRSNPDGSQPIGGLRKLTTRDKSETITIPDNGSVPYWRGTFFAREGCRTNSDGSGFHCAVGDCGPAVDQCTVGQQPVSLAEFNFDNNDGGAPWYDVSYVDALSLPITITPAGGDESSAAGSCAARSCTGGGMLAACPSADAVSDPNTGTAVCVNRFRDIQSSYTQNLGAFDPRAYLWSHDDKTGRKVVFNCPGCSNFVVTFHGSGGQTGTRPPLSDQKDETDTSVPHVHSYHGLAGKCVDVPGGQSNDGLQLQLWDCNGTPAQAFTSGPDGQEIALGKCMDVAWAGTTDGTKVQLAWCNGGPAQVWVPDGQALRNPNSNKCLDVPKFDSASGTPLQIWDCNGGANQQWKPVPTG